MNLNAQKTKCMLVGSSQQLKMVVSCR